MGDSGSYASAGRSNGPTMSMIDAGGGGGAGVGNYKGVMLCNRPFGGSTVQASHTPTGGKTTFNCGVVPEKLGLNVPIPLKDKSTKRTKKDSVLSKHKKWLNDLQKTKDSLEQHYLEEMQRKEEEKAKFREQEKKNRELAIALLHQAAAESKDAKAVDLVPETTRSLPDIDSSADAKKPTSSAAGAGKSNRPAWALSEKQTEEGKKASDKETDDADFGGAGGDEENLLNFAKNLDYEKYIDDVEVRTVMEKLRKRIVDYEREIASDEKRDEESDARRAARQEMIDLMSRTEADLNLHSSSGAKDTEESRAMSAARILLSEDEQLKDVHSTRSVSTMVRQAKDKIENIQNAVRVPGPPAEPKVSNGPLIITHIDNGEQARAELKNAVSSLAYLHRNPAV